MTRDSKNSSTNARVCMLVWNHLIHDARVVKEASTLARNGWHVTVVALADSQFPRGRGWHNGGFETITIERPIKRERRTFRDSLGAKSNTRKSGQESQGNGTCDPITAAPGARPLSVISLARIAAQLKIMASVVRARPQVVHVHDVNMLPIGWVAARVTASRLIYDAHEISADREGYRHVRWLIRAVEKILARRAVAMITTTESRATYFNENYGIDGITVLQNRPPYQRVVESRRLRECLPISDGLPIVLYQGGIQQGRGLTRLVRVANRVPDAKFVLLGSGRQADEVKQLIANLGLERRVLMHPAVSLDELHEFTCSATIGVQLIRNTCLNHYTTDSNKVFEYIMAGLPVVASDFPEIRNIVAGQGVGIVVDPESEDDIVRAIRNLLGDPAQLTQYQTRCRVAAQELSWDMQEEKLCELYHGVCGLTYKRIG